MIEFLVDLITSVVQPVVTWANLVGQGNDFATGVILAALSTLLTGFGYFLTRRLPRLIRRQIVVSVSVVNVGLEAGIFNRLNTALTPYMDELGSRTFHARIRRVKNKEDIFFIPGLGMHRFFYKGRLFWLVETERPSDGSEKEKRKIKISTFSFTKRPLESLVNDLLKRSPNRNEVNIMTRSATKHGIWVSTITTSPGLKGLTLNQSVRDFFTTDLKHFVEDGKRAQELFLPYKRSYMIHGEPGTGKTSLALSIAHELEAQALFVLEGSKINQNSLGELTEQVARKSSNQPVVVLLEDLDRNDLLLGVNPNPSFHEPSCLDQLLNFLSGVIPLENVVVVMTTNNLSILTKALWRPERVTSAIDLPRLKPDVVNARLEEVFPFTKGLNLIDFDIRGCDLALLTMHLEFDLKKIKDTIEHIRNNLPAREHHHIDETHAIKFD